MGHISRNTMEQLTENSGTEVDLNSGYLNQGISQEMNVSIGLETSLVLFW